MLYGIISKIFRKNVYRRNGYSDSVFYFSAADFSGLRERRYEIKSSLGHTLAGRFYSYEGAKSGRIIIFEHGMGAGHRSYMKEIECLCRFGYNVFAYDHTGCAESGGESMLGFVGSLIDLNDVLSALKADAEFSGVSFSVVGHSWGGFSALNISAYHPDLTHIVAMSGFVSVERIINQFMGKIPFGMAKRVYAEECEKYPEFATASAERSLLNTDAKVLVIHSRDDKTVSAQLHFDYLKNALSDKENISFLEISGRDHNPNYTEEALKYKEKFFNEHKKAERRLKRGGVEAQREFAKRYDFDKMTEQDSKLWEKIYSFLES